MLSHIARGLFRFQGTYEIVGVVLARHPLDYLVLTHFLCVDVADP
jgi:hypothetical protein